MDESDLAHHERDLIAALEALALPAADLAALPARIAAAPPSSVAASADQHLVEAA